MKAPTICAVCPNPLPSRNGSGRHRTTCSEACRAKKKRIGQALTETRIDPPPAPTLPETVEHPVYPLALEERVALITSPSDPDTIRRIQTEFARRRNAEFEGWQDSYQTAVLAWIAWHSKLGRA